MFIEQWSTNHNYSLSKKIFNPTVLISQDTHFTLAEGKNKGFAVVFSVFRFTILRQNPFLCLHLSLLLKNANLIE